MTATASSRLAARARWLPPAAFAALCPKCLLCVWAYLAAAAGLGLAGRQICGAPGSAPPPALIAATAVVAIGSLWAWRPRRRVTR